DRYATDRGEPEVDQSQDYELLLGYENGTHTVIRFRRQYDTCDQRDYKITNGTVRLIYSYHDFEPPGLYGERSLPYHGPSQRGTRSLNLIEMSTSEDAPSEDTLTWDLRNPEKLPLQCNGLIIAPSNVFSRAPNIGITGRCNSIKVEVSTFHPLTQFDIADASVHFTLQCSAYSRVYERGFRFFGILRQTVCSRHCYRHSSSGYRSTFRFLACDYFELQVDIRQRTLFATAGRNQNFTNICWHQQHRHKSTSRMVQPDMVAFLLCHVDATQYSIATPKLRPLRRTLHPYVEDNRLIALLALAGLIYSAIHHRRQPSLTPLLRMMKGTCMGTFKADYLPSVSLREDVVSIYALCSPSWRRSRVKTTILGCCNIAAASVHNTEGCSFHSYEPLLQPDNSVYISNIIVYECQGSEAEFGVHARGRGQLCYQPNTPSLRFSSCSTVIIAWALGSKGFSFPPEAGYPLDPDLGPRYFMMETHYNNLIQDSDITDSSGIRVYYTASLRLHDAGVLSVGLDPNWRHIIPPGQPEVLSEGHCISACTEQALPPSGIKVFAVVLHTHLIVDNNYNYRCEEYRRLQKPVTLDPGDHLIAQCVYNSKGRTTITLGGLTTREEMCLVFALYYPRVDMSLCHSLPSLPTVLHSLGIQELWP
ncbi:hypothetical protein Cfor_08829, partial [Coptotermes formosanus]